MCASHAVRAMSAYRAGSVSLSVRLSLLMIQVGKPWTDMDKVWYGYFATGDCPKHVPCKWRAKKLVG